MNKTIKKKCRQAAVSLILAILAACFVSVPVYAEPETECEHLNLSEAELHWNDCDVTYAPTDNHDHQITGDGWTEAYCLDCGEAIMQEGIEINEKQPHQFVNNVCEYCGYRRITGWYQSSGKWYYYGQNGNITTGWKEIKGIWYYFNSNGVMATGWLKDGSVWYYLKSSGAMATGWQKIGGAWYYLKSSGAMATGWLKNGSVWYYLKSDGAMATSWQKVSGAWYYLKSSGAMTTGWLKDDGIWYYLKSDGAMATGWQQVGSSWYYFKANGSMASNEWIQQGDIYYRVDSSGIYITKISATAAQSYSSSTNYLIMVSRSSHFVTVYQGSQWNWKLIKGFSCGDGKSSTPTITGEFSIPSKYPRSHPYFDSGSARCWYPTRIHGGYLFHSVLYYQTGSPSRIMDPTLGRGVSHGCVRLALNNAKWIYDNIPIGTKVVIH